MSPAATHQRPPAPGVLARYRGIYAILCRNSVIREMGFKLNFLLWIVVEFLWFAMQLAFMSVVYSHTDRIGDWTRWQVVLLVGASHFVQQLFTALFLSNLVQLSEHVRTGRLDFFLLLPANPRFLLSLRVVDLGSFINAASAAAVMAYALRQLGVTPSALQLAGCLVACAAALLVHYSLMFIMASTSFWTVRAQGVVWGYYNLFNLARLPDTALPHGFFRAVFTFALPMLLVANVPARLLAGTLQSPLPLLLLVGVSAACFAGSALLWRFSVRRYTSASS